MNLSHISIFFPNDSVFYRRLFVLMEKAFKSHDVQVSGCCRLLSESEIKVWLDKYRPDAIFEMNRVKNDVPILHEHGIPHVTWIVDFQGRVENQIRGSDITYFFEPGWNSNFSVGGVQDWLPPGTCSTMFAPNSLNRHAVVDFSFIGHIPRPWSTEDLNRKLDNTSDATFGSLLHEYNAALEKTEHEVKTHNDLLKIIEKICVKLSINIECLDSKVYYDLMERTKRVKNRLDLLGFAIKKSNSIAIYGSSNWQEWGQYKSYYNYYVDSPKELNIIYQSSQVNLHDGVSFHFRAIDCLASGGDIFWYDNYPKQKAPRGLHEFFEDQRHFYSFGKDSFDVAYENRKRNAAKNIKAKEEVINIIKANHTWLHRANKIINDIKCL